MYLPQSVHKDNNCYEGENPLVLYDEQMCDNRKILEQKEAMLF